MFCKNCGTMLRDDAKFCASCGTPVSKPVTNQQIAPNTNTFTNQSQQNAPNTGYNQNPYQNQQGMNQNPNMYQNANPFSIQPSQPVQSNPFNAQIPTPIVSNPFMEAPVMQTPVMQIPVSQSPFNQTPSNENYQAQSPFNNNYTPQYQDTNTSAGNANEWGPLMTPKKKSKLPLILILLFVTCAIVASAFLLIKTFILGNSPEDALESVLDAASTNKTAELFDNAHPIFNDMLNELKDSDLSEYADQMESSFMDSVNPESKKFSYSDLVMKKTEMKQSELDTLKSDMKSAFSSMKSMDSDFSLNISDYDFEEGYEIKGTLKINDEKYEYESTVVKTDGKWYIFDISIY